MLTARETPIAVKTALPSPILMAGAIGQALLFGVVAPALPSIAASLGDNAATIIPLLLALPSLGLIVAGFLAGPLLERIGPRNGLILGSLGFILFGSLPAVTAETIPLLASRLLLGVSCGITATSATVLLVANHDGDQRSRMLGYQTGVGSAIGLVALIASGALVGWVGWHMAFLLYGICLAPMLVIAMTSVPDLRPASEEVGSAFAPTLALLWPVYLAASLLFVVPVAYEGQMAFLLSATGTHDPMIQSIIIAIGNIGSAIAGAVFGRVYHLAGPRRSFALALAISGVGLILIGFATSPLLFGIGAVLNGLAVGLYVSYLWLVAARLAPPEMRPRGLALLSTAMFLGGFLYPAVFGALAFPFGAVGAFLLMGAIMLVAAIAALTIPRGRLLLNGAMF